MLAPLIGALILWLSDQLILWLTRVDGGLNRFDSALIGAPLLLWLLPRLRSMSAPAMNASDSVAMNVSVQWFVLGGLVILLAGILLHWC
jgi:iron complex transport system permease protein